MAVSGNYGKGDVPAIGEDEPVFILRAQDRLAEPTIEMYRLLAALHGCELVQSLPQELQRFRQWKGARKLPDQTGQFASSLPAGAVRDENASEAIW